MGSRSRSALDSVFAAVLGGVVGAIVAVNFVIYSGIEGGYEASLQEVFRQSVVIGIVTVIILLAGPVVGVVIVRRGPKGVSGSGPNGSARADDRGASLEDGSSQHLGGDPP